MTVDSEVMTKRVSQRQRDLLRVEETVEAAIPLAEPGHVFTHEWLDEQLGIGPAPADTASYKRWHTRRLGMIDWWREAMGKRHIVTDTTRGEGYAVIAHRDAVPLLQRQSFQAVSKAIKTGLSRIEVWVDPDQLLPHERQKRFDALGSLRNMKHALEQARPRPPRMPTAAVPAEQALLVPPQEPQDDHAG